MSNAVPAGWNRTTLGKVAKLTMGQSPLSDTYNTESHGLPFFQGKADFGSRYPRVRYWCSEPTKVASEQSILFSVRAPVGEVNITPYECCIGRGLAGIYGETADQEFLFQKLQYAKPRFQLLSQGSTFEAVNGSDLKEFDLTLPPLPEQQKIATILSSVDDVIEKTRAQINKLKDLKTGMMQELLTKGIGHTEFKDSPVGRIPVGWDVLFLDELVKAEKNITYGIVQAGAHYEGGVPYIRVSDMTERALSRSGVLLTSPEIATKYQRSAVSCGDIVYALRGVIGHVLMVPKELDGANLTQGTARISPNDKVDSSYLLWAMKSPYVNYQNDLAAKGSTFREVTLASLRKIQIALPVQAEQKKIASVLSSVELKIFTVEDKLAYLKSIKKALMQDLLTGKVRVNTKKEVLQDVE